jgi:hypothetical protein
MLTVKVHLDPSTMIKDATVGFQWSLESPGRALVLFLGGNLFSQVPYISQSLVMSILRLRRVAAFGMLYPL